MEMSDRKLMIESFMIDSSDYFLSCHDSQLDHGLYFC